MKKRDLNRRTSITSASTSFATFILKKSRINSHLLRSYTSLNLRLLHRYTTTMHILHATFFLHVSGVDCNSDTCIGLSSGTAATVPQQPQQSNRKTCLCQCHSHLPAFREDLQICVDDIRGEFK